MRVVLDRDRCLGAGNCLAAAASIFDQDEHGLVVLRQGSPSEEWREAVESAVAMCPGGALSIEDTRAVTGSNTH
jgi:ferredoxin